MSGDSATVRWARLDGVAPGPFEGLLSEDELARAAGFRQERDGHRFVVTRGLVYTLLGERLGTDPARVELACGAHGKPCLAAEDAALRFSVSHSGGIVTLAFCEGREVGIDVERVRGGLSTEAIARRHLPEQTVRQLDRLGPEERARAFFRAWVRLEAYVKGDGRGLGLVDEHRDPEGWSILDLDLLDGYAAALAIAGDSPVRVDTAEIRLDRA